ncbi:uncharacterized protein ACRADG_006487 isoform 2-T2 [Cochliomyia hominivorax]
MESDHSVAVTHFINPHLFWYKTIKAPDEQFHVLTVCEQKLLELYKNKPLCDNFMNPQIGDKVAVNFIAWNKFIRAKILEKAEFQQEEYIVWAMDYGFPLLTKKDHLRTLPSNLQVDANHIKVGGIANIYPAEQEYDDMEGDLKIVTKDKWLQKTCSMLEKLLADANSISFIKKFETNNHNWGDLYIVNHKGVKINARDFLLKTTNATDENGDMDFRVGCSKFTTIKVAPWLSNDRKTKMKFNTIKHNYVEHSKQMNATMVDENAKRKVEDWQERNERRNVEVVSDLLDTTCDISEDNIYDITFEDSISVVNNHPEQQQQQQINYIGKAGALTKIKQQKYPIEKELQRAALKKSFDIKSMFEPQLTYSTRSSPTHDSSRSNKLYELCVKPDSAYITKKINHNSATYDPYFDSQSKPLIDMNPSASSTVSSVKLRQQKLAELRKKAARAVKEKKINEGTFLKPIINNETAISTINHTNTSDSYSYQLLEQSLTLNSTSGDNTQDSTSELSVKNLRAKHLIAMRKKYGSSTISSLCIESGSSNKEKEEMDINSNLSVNNFDFQLKPKTISTKPDIEIKHFEEIYSVASPSTITTMDKSKLAQSGYENLTMVPAGYDITRLQTYNNEETHWHRKKTTLYDYVPHELSSSTGEFLSNNTNDQSVSSSDFFQIKPPKKLAYQTATNHINPSSITIPNTKVFETQTQVQELKKLGLKGLDEHYLPSDVSTSTNSTVPSQSLHKRRQLKSPASQLSKIDRILMENNIEKEMGNPNTLDLKRLNTSSSSQKSLLSISKSSNNSTSLDSNENIPPLDKNTHSNSTTSKDHLQNEKVYKDVCNYGTLIDVKFTENLPVIDGEHKIQTKFIDHLVLAHSSIQLTTIENVSDAPFLPEIHEEMRQMRVTDVYRIQVYSWSHVLRSNSLFVINPPRSGKTWSYLPALCTLLCCRADSLKNSCGPAALILVASLKHVELITHYCRRLMTGLKTEAPTCVPSYGMRNMIETKIQLHNGCGILIATPASLLRLFNENNNERLFDPERLQHIVIDDMDKMMSRSQRDFENSLRLICKMARKSKFKKLLPQIIVTSCDWDATMAYIIRISNQPLLLIGDFLEAAVYGHATLSIKFKLSSEKNNAILKFLTKSSVSNHGVNSRTLIMCNDDEDVQELMKFLHDSGYHCLGFYNRSTEIERVTINEWKKELSSQILICTDARFCELKIQNANNLIHYSMPTSWTRFITRFSALANTYKNYIIHNFEKIPVSSTSIDNKQAYSMILLDENNNLQLPRLVEFMRKHNQKVHDEILAVSKRVQVTHEEQRIVNGALLCPQLMEFGECEGRCDKRHELTLFDVIRKRDEIPCSGEIRLHVLQVFSPTYYAVRLLQHKPKNIKEWHEIRRSSEALTLNIKLNMHYRNEKNLSLHWPPHINDICIYQYNENFRRARILEAPDFQQKNTNVVQTNLKVTLKLIDDGNVVNSVKCNEIFVCDDKFKNFPPQAIDMRLMNIVPFDNERSWDLKTKKQVQKWIMEDIKSNYVIQSSIEFSLAETIWVKNIFVMEQLTGIDAFGQVVNLKKSLVEKNFAVLYTGDRKHIRDHAEEFGLLNYNESDDSDDNKYSDLDYESCKNESINLIKFSSSNDEGSNSCMASVKMEPEVLKKSKCDTDDYWQQSRKTNDIALEDNIEENWDDTLNSGQQCDEIYVPLKLNNISETVKESSKTETWSKLPLNEIVKVEIGDEGENGNWENIFLQIIDKNSMFLFDELNQLINKHIDIIKSSKEKQKKIYDFEPLHNCIVKYSNLYVRAKIYGVFGEIHQQRLYKFFLCDYACFTSAKIEDLYKDFLYETSDEIVTFTPYQAIHCTLAGIKWDRFTKRYQVTKDYLYACAILESDTNEKIALNLNNLGINSYKILLYECEHENEFSTSILFNKSLVDNGITVYDEKTKMYLEYEIGHEKKAETKQKLCEIKNVEEIIDSQNQYNLNKDEVVSCEQLMELIKSNIFDIVLDDVTIENIQKCDDKTQNETIKSKSLNSNCVSNSVLEKEKTKVLTTDSELDEKGHCTCNSNSNSIKSSICLSSIDTSKDVTQSLPPPLKALHKRPQTTWYESDCMIFLSIYAPDIKNYLLEVTSKTILFVAEVQLETTVLKLNLLGSIDPQSVSHEIKGLNVVVRLKKIVFEKWPRLLKEPTKYSWLKYNFNTFDANEMEYIMPQQRLHTILDTELNFEEQQIDNYNSDEDSERELYQTYNPINDNDDDYDPFSAF